MKITNNFFLLSTCIISLHCAEIPESNSALNSPRFDKEPCITLENFLTLQGDMPPQFASAAQWIAEHTDDVHQLASHPTTWDETDILNKIRSDHAVLKKKLRIISASGHNYVFKIDKPNTESAYIKISGPKTRAQSPDTQKMHYISAAAFYLRARDIIARYKFKHVFVPETYALHLANQPADLDDAHYVTLQKSVEDCESIVLNPQTAKQNLEMLPEDALQELVEFILHTGHSNTYDVMVNKNGFTLIHIEQQPKKRAVDFFQLSEKEYKADVIDGLGNLLNALKLFPTVYQKCAVIIKKNALAQSLITPENSDAGSDTLGSRSSSDNSLAGNSSQPITQQNSPTHSGTSSPRKNRSDSPSLEFIDSLRVPHVRSPAVRILYPTFSLQNDESFDESYTPPTERSLLRVPHNSRADSDNISSGATSTTHSQASSPGYTLTKEILQSDSPPAQYSDIASTRSSSPRTLTTAELDEQEAKKVATSRGGIRTTPPSPRKMGVEITDYHSLPASPRTSTNLLAQPTGQESEDTSDSTSADSPRNMPTKTVSSPQLGLSKKIIVHTRSNSAGQ